MLNVLIVEYKTSDQIIQSNIWAFIIVVCGFVIIALL